MSAEQPSDAIEIAAFVKAIVEHLERPGFPEGSGCSHHGLNFAFKDESISIAARGQKLQVMIYRSNWPDPILSRTRCSCCHTVKERRGRPENGYPASVHKARAAAIAKALGCSIQEDWNGGEGHSGISIVFNRSAPDSLRAAMDHGSSNTAKFDAWAEGDDAPKGPEPTPKAEPETKIIKIVIDAKTGKPTDKPTPTFRDLISWARMAEIVRRSGVLQPRLSHLIVGDDGIEFCYPDDEEAKR